MASFVKANRKRQLDDWKMLANVGYSGGVIASMALQKTRPRFEEVFSFPKDDAKEEMSQAKLHEAQMIVWAEQANREYRRREKEEKCKTV